jgi:hypothetical protein
VLNISDRGPLRVGNFYLSLKDGNLRRCAESETRIMTFPHGVIRILFDHG